MCGYQKSHVKPTAGYVMFAYSARALFRLPFFIFFLNTERDDICFISKGSNL